MRMRHQDLPIDILRRRAAARRGRDLRTEASQPGPEDGLGDRGLGALGLVTFVPADIGVKVES
jgi:hypothetical protein